MEAGGCTLRRHGLKASPWLGLAVMVASGTMIAGEAG
jgi:hypothetical protein